MKAILPIPNEEEGNLADLDKYYFLYEVFNKQKGYREKDREEMTEKVRQICNFYRQFFNFINAEILISVDRDKTFFTSHRSVFIWLGRNAIPFNLITNPSYRKRGFTKFFLDVLKMNFRKCDVYCIHYHIEKVK